MGVKQSGRIDLDVADGSKLPCRILRFERGGLASQQILVLNYYLVDGEYSPDVELLRSKIWQLSSGANYVAQVQVVCSGRTIGRSAEEAARAFATASARPIHSLFPSDAERANEE